MFDGTLTIDTHMDTKGFDEGVVNLVKGLKGLALTAGTVILGLLGIQSVKAVANLSAEFQRLRQAAQAVGQIYGIAAPETRKLIDDLTASGIQSNIASRAFINFAKEGLDLNLLPALARGAQDLNALAESGQSSSDVFNGLLTGILKLDTQMLRDRGVVIDLNKAYKEYASTIGKSTEALSVQERRAAAMTAVIEKLSGVTGLYELSQKTAAGQMSSNKRIMIEFKNVIGSAFQPAFFNLIKGFNDLVKALTIAFKEGGRLRKLWLEIAAVATVLSRIIRSLMDALTAWLGIQVSGTAGVHSTNESMNEMTDSANTATEAEEELGDAIEEAGKKAKGALAAFDELNVLQQAEPEGPTTQELPELAMGEVDLASIEDPLEEIQNRADELILQFQEMFKPLLENLEKLKIALEPFAKKIWAGLQWGWENILKPLGKWILTEAVPKVLELIAEALELLDITLEALKPGWDWFWENVLKPLGEAIGEALLDFLGWLIEKFQELGKWIKGNEETFQKIVLVILVLTAILFLLLHPIALVTAALIALILLFRTDFVQALFTNMVNTWKKILLNTWENLKKIDENIRLFIDGVGELLRGIFTGNWELAWDGIKKMVQASLDNIVIIIKAGLGNVLLFLGGWKNAFMIILAPLVGWFSTHIIEPIKEAFNRFFDWIKDKFYLAFSNAGSLVKGAFNAMIDLINKLLSKIATSINNMASIINQFSWLMGFQIPTVTVPTIPHLATGAVIPPNNKFLAVLGDQSQGRNIEAPEGLIRQIIQEEVSKIEAKIEIEFGGSLSELARLLRPEIKREEVRIGKSLAKGGSG